MFIKFKKNLIISFMVILTTFIFIGCDNAKLSTDIKINSDGSTNSKVCIYYDETIAKIVNNDLFSKILGDKASNYSINKYKDNNFYVEEIDFSTEKMGMKKFSSNPALAVSSVIDDDLANFFDYDVTKKKGFLKNTYTLKISLNDSVLKLINTTIKVELDDELSKYIGSNFSSFFSDGISDFATKQIGTVPYDLTISTPIDIVDSNATTQTDSRHLAWHYTLGELNENTELTMSFTLPSFINIAIICIVVSILIIGLVIFIRHSKKSAV